MPIKEIRKLLLKRSKYMQWLASLEDSAVSPMNPFKITSTINPDGSIINGSKASMSGYTIIKAD